MRDVEAILGISRWTVLRKCKAGNFKWRYGTRHGHRVKLIHVSSLPAIREDFNSPRFDEATIAALVEAYIRARYVLRRLPGVGRVLVETESAAEQPMHLLKKAGVLELAQAFVRREVVRRATKLWSFYGYARNKKTGIPRLLRHLNTEAADIYRSAIATSAFEQQAKSRLFSLQGDEVLAAQDAVQLFLAACRDFESATARARLGPTLGFFKSAFTRDDIRRLTQVEQRLSKPPMLKVEEEKRPRLTLVAQVCAELVFRLDRKEPRWRDFLAVAVNPKTWIEERVFPRVHLDSLAPDIAPLVVQEMVRIARGAVERSSVVEIEDEELEELDVSHLVEAPDAEAGQQQYCPPEDGATLADIGWTEADLDEWHSESIMPQHMDPQT